MYNSIANLSIKPSPKVYICGVSKLLFNRYQTFYKQNCIRVTNFDEAFYTVHLK